MCDYYAIPCNFNDSFCNLKKYWCFFKHLFIYSSKLFYERLDLFFWIYQTTKLVCNFKAIILIYCNFCNSFLIIITSGCLNIYNGIHLNNSSLQKFYFRSSPLLNLLQSLSGSHHSYPLITL